MQAFLLSGLLVFTDKVIRKDDSEEIRRYLGMTKIGKIIQKEIQQAVDESVAWTKRETRKKTSGNWCFYRENSILCKGNFQKRTKRIKKTTGIKWIINRGRVQKLFLLCYDKGKLLF